MKKNKLALIGAGNIGGSIALQAALRRTATDIVLFDIVEGMPQGKALDLAHASPVYKQDFNITGTNNIEDIKDADVCIVTSGIPRKPGMSRDDLISTNSKIIKSVAEGIKANAPNAFVIVITNPLDAMVFQMLKVTGFDSKKVVGMAGVLDSSRYKYFLAQEIGVSVASINTFVLGGHGDTMVPIRSATTVNGIPIEDFIKNDRLEEIENRVRKAGGEIVGLLKTGSAFNSPAAAAIEMAESYLFNENKIIPCSAYLNGEYGINGYYMGVPAIIGNNGVEKVIEISLTDKEKELLDQSHQAVVEITSKI